MFGTPDLNSPAPTISTRTLSHAVKICLFQTRQRGSKLPRGDILPVTAQGQSTG